MPDRVVCQSIRRFEVFSQRSSPHQDGWKRVRVIQRHDLSVSLYTKKMMMLIVVIVIVGGYDYNNHTTSDNASDNASDGAREGERERERDDLSLSLSLYVYIYIYVYNNIII